MNRGIHAQIVSNSRVICLQQTNKLQSQQRTLTPTIPPQRLTSAVLPLPTWCMALASVHSSRYTAEKSMNMEKGPAPLYRGACSLWEALVQKCRRVSAEPRPMPTNTSLHRGESGA